MKTLKCHPACLAFPKLSEDELQELADDIQERGLLHPIVLLDGKILDGRNRFDACNLAGIEPRFVEWQGDGSPVAWVVSTNLMRRHLTSSQRAVVAYDILPLLEKEAKQRQRLSNGRGKKVAKNLATFSRNGKASEVAARIARTNSAYVETVKSIKSKSPELVERIRSGELNITEAKRIAAVSVQKASEKRAAKSPRGRRWKITNDQKVISCQVVITDPPYGITQEPWEPRDLEAFTRDWCRRWSMCGAEFIVSFWSQGNLIEGRHWFDESLEGYRFQQLLVWHAQNNLQPKSRSFMKQTWEPIFLYRRIGSRRQIINGKKVWTGELHNLDCYVASVPQSSYNRHSLKQHPCQKPVSVMRWLVHALTEHGDLVVDPFCGSGSTGIATVQLGRRFHGIEKSAKYRKIAEARIAAYGSPPDSHTAS
jgi:hypothetical protein